jgi:hypothetical protein
MVDLRWMEIVVNMYFQQGKFLQKIFYVLKSKQL